MRVADGLVRPLFPPGGLIVSVFPSEGARIAPCDTPLKLKTPGPVPGSFFARDLAAHMKSASSSRPL